AREAAGWLGDTPRTIAVRVCASKLPRTVDPESVFVIDLLECAGRLYEGESATAVPLVLDVLGRAAREVGNPRLLAWAATLAGAIGDEPTEAQLLRRASRRARESGAVDVLANVLLIGVLMRVLEGRALDDSEAAEGVALAQEANLPNSIGIFRAMLSWFAAVRGADAECLEHAEGVAPGSPFAETVVDWGMAILDLSRRRIEKASERLARVVGHGHPYFAAIAIPDLIEAYAASKRGDEARPYLATFDGFAADGAPQWARALAMRSRALLAESADADAAFEQALALHAEGEREFNRARTELLYGEFLRRERRRTNARAHLRTAIEAFEEMGALAWAE